MNQYRVNGRMNYVRYTDSAPCSKCNEDPVINDKMYKKKEPIGMCYVPYQEWSKPYCKEKALVEGTIFPELNQVFCGYRG